MIRQTSLRQVSLACTNSTINCEAVLPCFDRQGLVQQVLVPTAQWGWLIVSPAGLSRSDGRADLQFAGPLEKIFKLSPRNLSRLEGLFCFDPWWLSRSPTITADPAVAEALISLNLAPSGSAQRDAVSDVLFADDFASVQQAESGSSLWGGHVEGDKLRRWLGQIGRDAGGQPTPPQTHRHDELRVQTLGPLRPISLDRQVAGRRAIIGEVDSSLSADPLTARADETDRPGRSGKTQSEIVLAALQRRQERERARAERVAATSDRQRQRSARGAEPEELAAARQAVEQAQRQAGDAFAEAAGRREQEIEQQRQTDQQARQRREQRQAARQQREQIERQRQADQQSAEHEREAAARRAQAEAAQREREAVRLEQQRLAEARRQPDPRTAAQGEALRQAAGQSQDDEAAELPMAEVIPPPPPPPPPQQQRPQSSQDEIQRAIQNIRNRINRGR